jgi:tryptophan-rich sensory protein
MIRQEQKIIKNTNKDNKQNNHGKKKNKMVKRKTDTKLGFGKEVKKVKWKFFIVCILIVAAVAVVGNYFTDTGEWYNSIKSITPPNYIFPIVWIMIFYFIAVSLYYSWMDSSERQKKKIVLFYGINFALNILWSFLYFTLKSPLYALVGIIFLWISILYLIIFNWKINRKASYFLMPYLLWVSFVIVLNYLSIK